MNKAFSVFIITSVFFGITRNSFSEPPAERAKRSGVWTAPTSITLPSPQGTVRAVTKQIQLNSTAPLESSKTLTAQVVIVPSKRLYWVGLGWNFSYFVLKDSIVAAKSEVNDGLLFYPSTDHMVSLEDGTAVEKTLDDKIAKFPSEHLQYKCIGVKLWDVLGPFPFKKQPTAMIVPAPKITNINVNKDSSFTITFRGGKDDKVEAVIMFDDSFKPLSATLDGKQVYPKPQNQ